MGCPIRRSRDHRALAPPPSFSQRATSFIASRCQGIHQMPLSCSPTPSPKAAPAAVAGGRCQRSDLGCQTAAGRPGLLAAASSIPRPTAARSRCVSIAPTGATGPGVSAYPCPGTTDRPREARGPRRQILSCPLHGHDSLHDVKTSKGPRRPRRAACADLVSPGGRRSMPPANPRLSGGPGPTRTADLTLIRRAL